MLTTEELTETHNGQVMNSASSSERLIKSLLPHIAILITLITAFLYFLGRVYYEYYFSFWNLPDSLFPPSKEDLIFGGVISYILFGLSTMKQALLFLIGIGIIVYAILLSMFRPISNIYTKAETAVISFILRNGKKHIVVIESHDKLMNSLITVFTVFVIGFLVLLVLTFSYKYASDTATKAAQREYDSIISGKPTDKPFDYTATIYIKNDSKGFDQYSGHLITTSDTHCALYDPAKGVMIFNLSNISRLELKENKNLSKK